MSGSARTVASFGKAGFGSMSKRMALLIVSVWLALYAGQVLIRAVLDFIGASVVGSAWDSWCCGPAHSPSPPRGSSVCGAALQVADWP